MKKIILILVITFITSSNSAKDVKIKDVCHWYHGEIIGWHQNNLLFKKRYLKISDKSKYPDNKNSTIEKNLLKQKKLTEAIDKAQKKIQNFSKIYHYLECTRYERIFEKE